LTSDHSLISAATRMARAVDARAAAAAAPPPQPTTVVAIDFGTAATGYAISQAPPAGHPITSARVFPFKPGDRGASATEKNVTAVLLEAGGERRVLAFGRAARRRFHEMEPSEARNYLFLEQFKMALSAPGRVPLLERTVHALGADVAVPLVLAVAKVLEAVRLEAADRLVALSVQPGDVAWIVTVPAIWSDEAKHFMREAAVSAGIVGGASGLPMERLLLCLEPEGAIIASMVDVSPDVRQRLVVGSGLMVLDCGGGTVDVTVSEVTGVEPYALKEILPASGDAWGGTLVDAEARKFFNALLAPRGAHAVGNLADAASLTAVMDSWEQAKSTWDPEDPQRCVAKVEGLASVCEAIGGAAVMAERVTAFNAANGLEGADAVAYRPRAFALWLPSALVRTFFDACVGPICAHMLQLFEEADRLGYVIKFVFLVGGFAESVYLQRAVRAALTPPQPEGYAPLSDGAGAAPCFAELIVPNKPVQVVNRGSALWGLYPQAFIQTRVSRYTYAIGLAEEYIAALHEPLPAPSYLYRRPDGRAFSTDVLVPLVQRGDVLPIDFSVEREAFPLSSTQATAKFDLYRLKQRLPPLELGLRRCFVLKDGMAVPSVEARTVRRPAGASAASSFPSSPAAAAAAAGGAASAIAAGAWNLMRGIGRDLILSVSARPEHRRRRRRRQAPPELRALGTTDGDGDEFEEDFPDVLPAVWERDRVLSVSVDIVRQGGTEHSSVVSLFFGRTELSCAARSMAPGGAPVVAKLCFD
jgi:hypothetical protein